MRSSQICRSPHPSLTKGTPFPCLSLSLILSLTKDAADRSLRPPAPRRWSAIPSGDIRPVMLFTGYLRLALDNTRFLAFGFTMTAVSSVGQTFFIGVFGPAVRGEFGLSHTAWSAIYMAGTLASAAVLPWTGQQIDRMSLRRYATLVCTALIVATAFMAAVPSAPLLILAIFLLRQTGQGLASHTGTTATARHFHADRGKALALASMGFSAGKAILPVIAVLSIGAIGWRATYGVMAGVLAALLLPGIWWLLRHHDLREREERREQQHRSETAAGSWSRTQVLRDGRFYMLLPAVLAPSLISTALFFHHLEIAAVKGWSAAWLTGSYWIFAAGIVLASLAAGPLIDRITAARVLPAFLLPMVLGLLIIWGFDDRLWVWPYLLLIGLTSGLSYTAVTALWAEMYGTGHLGAIRSLAVSLSVFASALGPVIMGVLMDAAFSVETICGLLALYGLAATGLLIVGLNATKQPRAAPAARS